MCLFSARNISHFRLLRFRLLKTEWSTNDLDRRRKKDRNGFGSATQKTAAASLHPHQKTRIFASLSRPIYCSGWFRKEDLRKLTGFQAKRIRSIHPLKVAVFTSGLSKSSDCKAWICVMMDDEYYWTFLLPMISCYLQRQPQTFELRWTNWCHHSGKLD